MIKGRRKEGGKGAYGEEGQHLDLLHLQALYHTLKRVHLGLCLAGLARDEKQDEKGETGEGSRMVEDKVIGCLKPLLAQRHLQPLRPPLHELAGERALP